MPLELQQEQPRQHSQQQFKYRSCACLQASSALLSSISVRLRALCKTGFAKLGEVASAGEKACPR